MAGAHSSVRTQYPGCPVRELIIEGGGSHDFRDVHAAFAADTVATTMTRIQRQTAARRVQTVSLRDGSKASLRPVRTEDKHLLATLVEGSSPDSLFRRSTVRSKG